MSEQNVNKEEMTKLLKALIPIYVENKREADDYAKLAKKYNADIKNMMRELDISDISNGSYVIKRSIVKTAKMDEQKMIEILKRVWTGDGENPYIKTVEVVDLDAVENAMYNNAFSQDIIAEFSACDISTTIEKLTISKVKDKEDKENE